MLDLTSLMDSSPALSSHLVMVQSTSTGSVLEAGLVSKPQSLSLVASATSSLRPVEPALAATAAPRDLTALTLAQLVTKRPNGQQLKVLLDSLLAVFSARTASFGLPTQL